MSARVLYTSAGPELRYWKISKPYIEHYANKVGAKLVVIPKTRRVQRMRVLFDAMEKSLLCESDTVCAWVDADIIVRRTAPDIFGTPDKLLFCSPEPAKRVHPRWIREYKSFGVLHPRPYVITAIVRWSTRYARRIVSWLEVNEGSLPDSMDDQSICTLACWQMDIAVAYFPSTWHKMHWRVKRGTQFLHAASRNKVKNLCKLAKLADRRDKMVLGKL